MKKLIHYKKKIIVNLLKLKWLRNNVSNNNKGINFKKIKLN